MNLTCETILYIYTYKNRNVLCQIKSPRSRNSKNSCRCLSQEDWRIFDTELEKLLNTTEEWSDEKCLEFNIKSYVEVRVQRSSLSVKHFYECLGRNGHCKSICDAAKDNFVLECTIDFQMEISKRFSDESRDGDISSEGLSNSSLSCELYTKRKKKCKTPGIDFLKCDEALSTTNTSSEIDQIEPLITKETCNDNHSEHNVLVQNCSLEDEEKSPKADREEAPQNENIQTAYVDEKHNRSKSPDALVENIEENQSPEKKETENILTQSQHEIRLDKRNLVAPEKNKDIIENKDETCRAEMDMDCSLEEKSNESEKEISSLVEDDIITTFEEYSLESKSTLESAADSSPHKKLKRERKPKSHSMKTATALRRSERSPNKTKRFIAEQYELLSVKKHKSAHKTKNPLSTDDDDIFENNSNEVKTSPFRTPVNTKCTPVTSSSSSSSASTKKKRAKRSECQQEKRDMNKWLSKKMTLPSEQEKKTSPRNKPKSSSCKPLPLKSSTGNKIRKFEGSSENRVEPATPSPTKLEMPSKEQMQLIKNQNKLMQKENAITKAELNKMRSSSPEAVEILSLQNIPADEILDSFSTYKSELDEIYVNNYKKDYVKGHDGINHCFVMRLLQQNTRMRMLAKLTEVYDDSNGAKQATLFANALLPEWIIRVYMDKYNFTRQKAIEQVKAQEEFQLHMEAQNENSFMFD